MENLFKTDDPKEALDDDVSEDVTDEENDADGDGDDEELNDNTNVEDEDNETIGEKNWWNVWLTQKEDDAEFMNAITIFSILTLKSKNFLPKFFVVKHNFRIYFIIEMLFWLWWMLISLIFVCQLIVIKNVNLYRQIRVPNFRT